jgi:hypothetical protein
MFLLERGIRMKFRKMTALFAAAALVLGVAGTALAETVPGAVYEEGGKGEQMTQTQVRDNLEKAGVTLVPANSFSGGSIAVLVQAGLLAPDANGNINANAPVSMQEGLAIFAKALGLASKTDSTAVAAQKAKDAGFGPSTERPDHAMSRLEVGRLIAAALGIVPTGGATPFSDLNGLNGDDILMITALKKAGIFVGFPDGSFQPDAMLTVGQIAVLLDRILTFK